MKDSYQYVDENAKALFRVVVDRTDPKNKSVYQQGFLNGRYENTMEGVRRVPYQLPTTLDAINRNEPVFVVEGERDVHTLMERGLYATTNAGGALKWSDDYSQLLSGGRFVVLCDNDDVGRQHARAVIESLREHADPMSVRIVDLIVLMPELAPIKGADVTDFIERGGTIEQLLAAVERAQELAADVAAGPTYPEIDVRNLPAPLRQIVEASTPGQDAITALLASITSSGAVMPNVSVVVGGVQYSPLLYTMIIGSAASGKSAASVGRDLIVDVHKERRAEYRRLFEEYERQNSKRGRKAAMNDSSANGSASSPPPILGLLVPGNSTSTTVIEHLSANQSSLIFETETDVTASLLKAEFGDFSAVFRQAFAHEPVSIRRVKLIHPIEVGCPKLSVCLCGTPSQVVPFFRDATNGLLSRFCFHVLSNRTPFRQPFDADAWHIARIGIENAPYVKRLSDALATRASEPVEIRFTEHQRSVLEQFFIEQDAIAMHEDDLRLAAVRRLPVHLGRVASILTILRHFETYGSFGCEGGMDEHDVTPYPKVIEVDDRDLQTALELCRYFLESARYVVQLLPQPTVAGLTFRVDGLQAFFKSLPDEFERKHAITQATLHGVSVRTMDRALRDQRLFTNVRHGVYRKVSDGNVATWQTDNTS